MVSITLSPDKNALRQIHRVQALTIIWISVEAAVSLVAAWVAHSPALVAFGGDSAIELLSAAVVLWAFTRSVDIPYKETRAARVTGILLFVLAGYVTVVSAMAFLGYSEPEPSYPGIAILIAAAAIMPWLAREKRKLSVATGSAALRADAAESSLCGYLALIALAGLLVNFVWKVGRADSIAALAIIPFIVREGREAMRGKPCVCE